ncbi:MAG: hypothetical protein LBD31_10760 [Treponema sp.]|jgi:hypothetical protein|nr:hypothetical protein [Treponema sp.]
MEQSTAAQVIIAILPLAGIVMSSVVAFFYLLWYHRRRVLLIKSGQYRKPSYDLTSFSLFTGLLLSSVGLGLTVFLAVVEGAGYGLLGGVIPLSIGTGLLAYFIIIRRGNRDS